MRSLLHQLENNEAVLLLYLSGELPPEDREEVEQQLASDAGMRRELESLRDLESTLTQSLSKADGLAMPSPVAQSAIESAAVRRFSRAMVKIQVERAHADSLQSVPVFARSLRLPAWSYPFATAAMILIGWVAYWGFSAGSPSRPPGSEVAGRVDREWSDELPFTPFPAVSSNELAPHPLAPYLPSMGVDDGDIDIVAIAAGSYEVSSMFQPVKE